MCPCRCHTALTPGERRVVHGGVPCAVCVQPSLRRTYALGYALGLAFDALLILFAMTPDDVRDLVDHPRGRARVIDTTARDATPPLALPAPRERET